MFILASSHYNANKGCQSNLALALISEKVHSKKIKQSIALF